MKRCCPIGPLTLTLTALAASGWLVAQAAPAPARAEVTPAQPNISVPKNTASVKVTEGDKSKAKDIKPPDLSIDIPTLKFTDIDVRPEGNTTFIDIPWIADYLQAIYRYAIGIGVFLTSVMVLIGGFIYLTAGDSGRVGKAKEMITDAVLGLAVLMGSFVLLNTLSPELTKLRPISVVMVEQESFSDLNRSNESISGSGTVSIDDKDLVNVNQLFKSERPPGFAANATVYRRANKKTWAMAKQAAALIERKGCVVVAAIGMGRTGMDQLNGVRGQKRGKLSSQCGIYYGCTVAMGRWCSTKQTEAEACARPNYYCKWTGPTTPDASAPAKRQCDVKSVLHTQAADMWAVDAKYKDSSYREARNYTCGTSATKCAKHRCQRELMNAWTKVLGGGMMMQNAKNMKSRGWESWHFCIQKSSYCDSDVNEVLARNGFPYPVQ